MTMTWILKVSRTFSGAVSSACLCTIAVAILFSISSHADPAAKAKVLPKKTVVATTAAPAAALAASRQPAALDPNRAIEIRGQSRTLSMMLVLKNGKENINFIRVRKDYNAEIRSTEF